MPVHESKFDVVLTFEIKEREEGKPPADCFRNGLTYSNMSYVGVVAVEHLLLEFVEKMHGMAAATMGEEQFLEAMALVDQNIRKHSQKKKKRKTKRKTKKETEMGGNALG